ncbi:hypothetical protein [Roseateles toxinivorans]|uniref:TonB C-terminal domain-containing protein n=1 Tax=Roseateles toxinivorans TaxID=270368 RepID=A0A4V3CSZ0_9BURK|nr:hypothetical protein [Roseateles toxinivorans]TDP62785.1 hypothetical protein DES47_10680 [Roseateles toxinivorans]
MAPRTAPLLAFVLASVGLHAAVLGTPWLGTAAAAPGGAVPRAVLVQVGAAAPVALKSMEAEVGPLQAIADGAAPVAVESVPPELQLDQAPLPALQLAAPATTEAGADDIYLPRSRLSVPPLLRSQVALLWPEGAETQGGHFRAVLALFIDELGVVQRVRVEGNGLPPALEAVARESFLGASFVPGELQGQAVKSLIRVEVRFDAERPAGSRGLRL